MINSVSQREKEEDDSHIFSLPTRALVCFYSVQVNSSQFYLPIYPVDLPSMTYEDSIDYGRAKENKT